MGNKDFDKFIKEHLKRIRPDFNPSDWDQMEGILDNAEFDQFVKEGLEDVQPAYQAGAWLAMEGLLEQQDMLDNLEFDQFVKEGLEDVQPAYQAGAWLAMEGLLEQQDMLDNLEFDQFVKEGLEDVQPAYQAGAWLAMEGLLEQQEILDNLEFDQFVKEGLEDVQPAYQAGAWLAMEGLLEQQDMLDNLEFDQFVKEGLEDVQPAYQSNEWQGMETALNKRETERKELVYIKGIELVLVILAVLTMFTYYSNDTSPSLDNPFMEDKTPIADIEDGSNNQVIVQKSDAENINNDKVDTEHHHLSNHNLASDNSGSGSSQTPNAFGVNVDDSNEPLTDNLENRDSETLVHDKHINPYQENSFENTHVVVNTESVKQATTASAETEEEATAKVSKTQKPTLPLDPIAKVSEQQVDFEKPELTMDIKVSKPLVRFGAQMGIDRNHVFTAYDPEAETSFFQGNYGFSSSMRLSVLKGKWEVESGLSYIRKQYRPNPIYQITGNARDGFKAQTLKKLSFNIVSIPLDLRFYFSKMSSKWKFYITSGAAFNAVGWSNYDRDFYTIKEIENTNDILGGRANSTADIQHAGILNGESLKDNFYITAALGAGMEVEIYENTNFFAQPKFTYYLLPGNVGLGPNNDHFNTISIDVGLRFKL